MSSSVSLKVGVLGSGQVAQVLAKGFAGAGHPVQIASRDGSKLEEFSAATGIAAGTFADVAAWADLIVLAVKGTVAASVAAAVASQAAGKVLIDVNNPIADAPPEDGILRYFTGPNDSLLEHVQAAAPLAHCVKAWSCVGNAFMIHPQFPGGRPTMFICGNDAGAKQTVAAILDGFGWDSEDIGSAKGARAIEPLCQLWCAPGMQRGQWTHAFKLLKL
jgi:predicted dinucleotide-binding enzyme